jgi:hypothetical protein
MSGTTPAQSTVGANISVEDALRLIEQLQTVAPELAAALKGKTLVNKAVAEAQTLPDLVKAFETAEPSLATALKGKTLVASKTPWGTLLVTAVGWAAAKYGLHWDSNTVDLVAGAATLAGAYVMRYVTGSRIVGVLRSKGL